MTDLNSVAIIGRLTRDAELKYTAGGMAISKFSVAVNRSKKDGDKWTEEASFFDVALWGKSAEAINQYLAKGKQVAVIGELRQERWQQDGQNRSRVEISASSVQLLGDGSQTREAVRSEAQPAKAPTTTRELRERASATPAPADGFVDDIPF